MVKHRRVPAAASVAAVFGGDDLLREILIRLGFPHYLVRAAAVSKRWLLHVSDPIFLRRFRERHPPHLLGFCVGYPLGMYEFVPLPQFPELAAFSRRAASSCNNAFAAGRNIVQWIQHCRNDRLVIDYVDCNRFEYFLLSPLLGQETKLVLPPAPPFGTIFLPDDGARDGITFVSFSHEGRQVRAKANMLGYDGWGVPVTSMIEIGPMYPAPCFLHVLPPVNGKIFVVTKCRYTLGLDLSTQCIFILELPDGVESSFMFSCAPNSGLYLVNLEGFQIRVWLHRMTGDNYSAGGWLLVDTFCIHEACARIAGDIWPHDVQIAAVGDNADFVFLALPGSGVVFYFHRRSKLVDKVYQRVLDSCVTSHMLNISPLVMIWPPIFPARNVEHDQDD